MTNRKDYSAMKKKEYMKPTIEVVELETESMILSISDGEGVGGDPNTPPTEELSNGRCNYWNEIGNW